MNSSSPTIDCLEIRVVLFTVQQNQLQVLLQVQSGSTYMLPGTSIPKSAGLEETALQAVRPVVRDHQVYLEQLYTYGGSSRQTDERLISVVYFALIPGSALGNHSIDEKAYRWFPINQLPNLDTDHTDIIQYALRRLRYKIEYSAVGFELLPDTFTLSALQKIYEIILGEKLDKRNFRRRILQANIIEATSAYETGEGRPARLYRYRADAVAEVKARRLFP